MTRAEAVPALLPGALVVVFGFQAGGFFPGTVALVAAELAAVAGTLNARPRKTLGWRTPAEMLNEYLASAA